MADEKVSPLPRTEMDALLLGRLDELTVSCESQGKTKSYLGICLSILVLLLISSLIVAAIVIINPEITNLTSRQLERREAITLEEAILGEIGLEPFEAEWLAPVATAAANAPQTDKLLYEDNKNLNVLSLSLVGASTRPLELAGGSVAAPAAVVGQPPKRPAKAAVRANVTTLVSNSSLLSSIDNQGYKLSPSGRYLLIWTAKKRLFRHSFSAKYFIYDTQTDMISLLGTSAASRSMTPASSSSSSSASLYNQYEPIDTASAYMNEAAAGGLIGSAERNVRFQSADWFSSPSGGGADVIDSLILVQNNDIYLLENVAALGADSAPTAVDESVPVAALDARHPTRLTFTGKQSEIFNGVADWLYEEEILADSQAFQVSPSGRALAYMSFNDSLVTQMPFTIYGPSEQVLPRVQRIRYPKAGQVNPSVAVHVVDNLVGGGGDGARTRRDSRLELPSDLQSEQHYLVAIKWLTEDKLALIWLRREQDLAFVVICDRLNEWACEKNLKLSAPRNGWLEVGSDDIRPLDKNFYLLLMLKHENDDVGSFKHIAKVSLNGDASASSNFTYLSSGRREVTLINGVDVVQELVYYTSTLEDEPGQRHLFVGDLAAVWRPTSGGGGGGDTGDEQTIGAVNNGPTSGASDAVCMSCHYYPQECQYNHIRLSPSGRHFVFSCLGPSVPRTELRRCPTRAQIDFRRRRIAPLERPRPTPPPPPTPPSSTPNTIQLVVPAGAPARDAKAPQPNGAGRQSLSSPNNDNDAAANSGNGGNGADDDDDDDDDDKLAAAESLLWVVEQNSALRERLEHTKAMPLNFRLKVALPNSNHSANVLLLLPPHLSSSTSYVRATATGPAAAAPPPPHANHRPPLAPKPAPGAQALISGLENAADGGQKKDAQVGANQRRAKRDADWLERRQKPQQPPPPQTAIGAYYTPETIQQYVDQLTQGQGPFPMVVDVYAGPGSQKVDFRFGLNFGHYLASSQRVVYALIDGRGSGFQGTKRLHELYRKFGTVEIADQIDVAAYLSNRFPFIDRARVGIWGWSYGGYAAAMALAQSQARAIAATIALSRTPNQQTDALAQQHSQPNGQVASVPSSASVQQTGGKRAAAAPRGVFECAVSVAPVTNWIYYDTAYTERYMSSPYMNARYDLNRVGDHLTSESAPTDSLGSSPPPPPPQGPVTSAPNRINELANTWQRLNKSSVQGLVESPLYDLMLRGQQQQQQVSLAANASMRQQTPNMIAATTTTSSSSLPLPPPPQTSPSQRLGPADLNQHYRSASLLENIKFIDRKRFLLIHGTADDNVHFQQSIMLMKQLIHRNILYETRFYPDQDHAIANRADKLHLGSTLTNFFDECFETTA